MSGLTDTASIFMVAVLSFFPENQEVIAVMVFLIRFTEACTSPSILIQFKYSRLRIKNARHDTDSGITRHTQFIKTGKMLMSYG